MINVISHSKISIACICCFCPLNDFHDWLENILVVWNLLVRQCIMRKDPTICHTMDILHGHTMRPGILNNIVEMLVIICASFYQVMLGGHLSPEFV